MTGNAQQTVRSSVSFVNVSHSVVLFAHDNEEVRSNLLVHLQEILALASFTEA